MQSILVEKIGAFVILQPNFHLTVSERKKFERKKIADSNWLIFSITQLCGIEHNTVHQKILCFVFIARYFRTSKETKEFVHG